MRYRLRRMRYRSFGTDDIPRYAWMIYRLRRMRYRSFGTDEIQGYALMIYRAVGSDEIPLRG